MTLPIYRLRRWLAVIATLFTMVVAGMYFYARQRQHSFLKEVPGKIGLDIKQTAKGFQFSKSDGGRTLFTIQASNLKQFKLNGRAQLHDVSIVLYGRDSSRFDRIAGDDFTYDPKTGDVSANGEVQIDLGANPAGLTGADQATPAKLSNPIRLKTSNLVFNKESGNASTDARVEFQTPQATGWAVGVQYAGKTNSLILASQVHLRMTGANAAIIEATRGVLTNEPRQIVLQHPSLERDGESLSADDATVVLGADNNVEHVFAHGNVTAQSREEANSSAASQRASAAGRGPAEAAPHTSLAQARFQARANDGDLLLENTPANANRLLRAVLSGDVRFERIGTQPMQGSAGRVTFGFSPKNEVRTVHADQGVKLTQLAASPVAKANASAPQNFELIAPTVDFTVAGGRYLQRAVTSGKGQITISSVSAQASGPGNGQAPQNTVITARTFDAKFGQASFGQNPEGRSHLVSIHGAPEAKIVSTNSGQPDRVSTSDAVDANFLAQGGIESITQQGHVVYTDAQAAGKQTQAWADRAKYTPGDQVLTLSGKPRVTQGSMTTTATTVRVNRSTGDANAEGDVKSTYSEMHEQPQGALLASGSPIHVTAASMTAHSKPAVAIYTGTARLWQDANIIEGPSIQFDRDCRCVTAEGSQKQPVATTIVQTDKAQSGKSASAKASRSSPIFITGTRLTYADAERRIHYEGGVSAKGLDFTASAKTMDLFLKPRSATAANENTSVPTQLERIVAQSDVIIQQPERRALGQTLVYEADSDKFTLTGGPPSIFDAERGKITGDSLTFFRRDDRVLVEGQTSNPVVTQTRVAR
jgi:lipopolysaccharide export system protein LptA